VVVAIPPPSAENESDERVGICSNRSDFAVSVMYDLLCNLNDHEMDAMWKQIWKLNVTERVRCFIRLFMHSRLLTNQLKSKMGLGHAMCRYCGDVEETSIHALRDCTLVVPFWLQIVPMEDRNIFFMEEQHQWIRTNLNKCMKYQDGSAWCDYLATACHNLWMWRNKEMHDENFVRPVYTVQHVNNRVKDYHQAKRANDVVGGREYVMQQIGWQPPSGNFVKINTDEARKQCSRARCGGIIRGSQGEWLGGFAKRVGDCSAFVAELWGVLEGLEYARRLGFMAVELNTDSVTVAQVILKGTLKSPMGATMVRKIRRLLALD
jgi:hypothetical protein